MFTFFIIDPTVFFCKLHRRFKLDIFCVEKLAIYAERLKSWDSHRRQSYTSGFEFGHCASQPIVDFSVNEVNHIYVPLFPWVVAYVSLQWSFIRSCKTRARSKAISWDEYNVVSMFLPFSVFRYSNNPHWDALRIRI